MPLYWQPTGAWKAGFRKALERAFDAQGITFLIGDHFAPESFAGISPVGPGVSYEFQLYQLIEHARMHDWLLDLVAAAHERRPKNPELAEIAGELGLALVGPRLDNPTGTPFEEVIRANAKNIDPTAFREKLGALEGRVCWVDIPGGGGTGFLISSTLVLTNHHVVERVTTGHVRWQDVKCRFDYKRAADGSTVDRKKQTTVDLDATRWLEDSRPPSTTDRNPKLGEPGPEELDYALLRLSQRVGDVPPGGDTGDPHAEPRGWIDPDEIAPPLVAGNQVFLLQHPRGEPLQLAIGTVTEFNTSGSRLRYDANSKDGSSGSPCFNADLQLVALHHAHDPYYPPKWNQAIPFPAIQKFWQDHGIVVSR